MPVVYDNWERLVEAILKREELRRLALCPSFGSCTSDDDSSCPSLIDSPVVDLTSGAGVGKRGFAAKAATLFAAPAIMRTLFLRTKPKLQHRVSHASGKLRRFLFRELLIATDNFNSINLLGSGGFCDVYKGRLEDGSLVAVKRCRSMLNQQLELEFQTELEIMSKAMHRNLLRLHGFGMTPKERLLVYPLMVHGSVASCLRERSATQPPLGWSTRKRIALGSARGLEFLHHCDPIVIHRDVKAANILLDEDFEAVVGDFGLGLVDPDDTDVTEPVCGTFGHIPPEYLSAGQVSEKTDVFGYGVMLLELVTGQRAFSLDPFANGDSDYLVLVDWVWKLVKDNKFETVIDPNLEGNYIKAEGEQLVQLALICTHQSPEKRPEMQVVVEMLESDEGLAERWKELQNDKMFRHQLDCEPINLDSDMQPDELSGPR